MRLISLNKAPAQQRQNVDDDVTRYALWVMKFQYSLLCINLP